MWKSFLGVETALHKYLRRKMHKNQILTYIYDMDDTRTHDPQNNLLFYYKAARID
jgi:hypothetical protein